MASSERRRRLNKPADAGGERKVLRKVSCLSGSWLRSPIQQTGAPDGRDEPSAPPHDRGHDRPQSVAGNTTILPACGDEVQPLFRTIPRSVGVGGRSRLSGPSRFDGHFVAGAEPDGLRTSVLLRHNSRPWRDSGADRLCSRTKQAAGGAERRRGCAVSGSGGEPEDAGGANHGLCRRAARLGDGRTEGARYRQRPDGDPGRMRQGR